MGTENDPDADPTEFARQILLHQLTHRPRSRSELAAVLKKKNVPQPIADDLLNRFEDVGLIDDEAFARAWAQSKAVSGGLAPRAISMQLRQKGIDPEIIALVVAEIGQADQEQAAVRLVQKKLRSMSALDEQTKTRRLLAMLARKGYAHELAFKVVRHELAAQSE